MSDSIVLEISRHGVDHHFPARLVKRGFRYVFLVQVANTEWCFEPDEEGNYRAILSQGQDPAGIENSSKELLAAISAELEAFNR